MIVDEKKELVHVQVGCPHLSLVEGTLMRSSFCKRCSLGESSDQTGFIFELQMTTDESKRANSSAHLMEGVL